MVLVEGLPAKTLVPSQNKGQTPAQPRSFVMHPILTPDSNPNPRQALDPVAGFHLRNGATLHALHWRANPTVRGMHESGGIMVSPTHTHAPQQDHAPMHHAHAHTPTPTSRRPPLPPCPPACASPGQLYVRARDHRRQSLGVRYVRRGGGKPRGARARSTGRVSAACTAATGNSISERVSVCQGCGTLYFHSVISNCRV